MTGGGVEPVPLEQITALETCLMLTDEPPASRFDQQWARTLFDHALAQLDAEIAATEERQAFFKELRQRVCGPQQWDELAQRFVMSTVAVRKAAHDLRQRFATLLRHEVRKVVSSDEEVNDELLHLAGLLAG